MLEENFINKLHKLSFLNRDEVFKNSSVNMDKFSNNLGKIEKDPFIGYIGKDYFKSASKICFLGKSNAESKKFNDFDIETNKSLEIFRNSKSKDRINSYSQYCERYKRVMPKWQIFKIPFSIMNKLSINIDDISYANILPWRYKGDPSKNKTISKIAWENFTNEFLSIVSPKFIIPLGKYLDINNIEKYYFGNAILFDGIERHIGDTKITELADKQIEEICEMLLSVNLNNYK